MVPLPYPSLCPQLATVTSVLRSCSVEVIQRQLSGPDGAAIALVVPDGAVSTAPAGKTAVVGNCSGVS